MKKLVFLLQHLHIFPDGGEDLKTIGVYSSAEDALLAMERLKIQPGFADYPKLIDPLKEEDKSGFYIDEYELNKDHYQQGFFTD